MLSKVMGTALTLLTSTFIAASAFAQDPATFVYADAGEPSTIDPAKANVNWEFTVTRNVYDRLVDFDLDDPSKLLPALATQWKQEGTAWTFTLREGVTFHDGSPFDANDVKATLDRLLKIGQGQAYLVDDIASVTVVDPKTVRIETKAPTVFLASNLSRIEMIADEDVAKHKDDLGEAWFSENANGTGPYAFVAWTRGTQIELKRNDKWWGKFPAKPFDRVLDRFVADGANRARGLEGGEFDLANFVPLDEALRIGGTSGFHMIEGNNLWAWPAIYLNMDLAPTNNKDFRNALVKAFDYSAMVQSFQGRAEVGRGPIPAWFPGSPEKGAPEIKTDLDAAKAALAASGLANATMKCSVPAGFPEFRFAATVLQSSAAQIGVTVEIEEAPFVEAITAIKTDKSNCFILGNANLSPQDATKFFSAHYLKGGFYNSGKFFDQRLQDLVAKLPTVEDPAERAVLLKQAAEIVVDAHAIIWTARPKTVVPEPDRIGGYRIDPAEYINARFWELYSKE
ncbi:ABC-type transport system substrate-binding protein [Mesorhizobium robiniae]|uniref:ABC-type transport system substrate-binding protein n=1 Tax=Mesorhizobium robiniae TaxID=559315 RepID=A0ABV2GIP7_9HYPH